MKKIMIGVIPQEEIRKRALAIARGEYKPKPGEPKVWFTKMTSAAEVLSDFNPCFASGDYGPAADQNTAVGKLADREARVLTLMRRAGR